MKDYIGKFIGANEIERTEPVEEKTYLGNERTKVVYKGGESKVFPSKVLECITTDKLTSPTELQNLRIEPVAAEVLAIMLEADLTLDDAFSMTGSVASKVNLSIESSTARAFNKLLGKEVYFNTVRGTLTLMDLDKMLKEGLVVKEVSPKKDE